MKHLLDNWDEVQKKIEGKVVILCLDYDGTLTPIVAMPDDALLPIENKSILESLAKNPLCLLAIVSGRALADVKEKVNIKNIMYIGNHGLEIDGPQLHFKSLASLQEKVSLDRLKNELDKGLSSIEGVWIEDKGLTLSVHYRKVHEADEPLVKKIFQKICSPYVIEKRIRITEGKKVLEIRPPIEWDKGNALLWLLTKERLAHEPEHRSADVVPIFIGDDVTDEDALAAIAGKGVGVVVGEGSHSKAEYFLNNTHEVTAFLKRFWTFLTTQAVAGK